MNGSALKSMENCATACEWMNLIWLLHETDLSHIKCQFAFSLNLFFFSWEKTVAKPSLCMTNATRHLKTFLTHLWENDVDDDGGCSGSCGVSVNLHNYFSNYFPSLISSTTAFCFNLIIDFSTIYQISIEIHVIGSQCKLFNCFWGFPQNWQLILFIFCIHFKFSFDSIDKTHYICNLELVE